jgi:phytoene synthase
MTVAMRNGYYGAVIARGSKSFALAAGVLDPGARDAAHRLYAWCRYCDDITDGQTLGHGARPPADRAAQRSALASLRAATEASLRGRPPADPVFAGLAHVVRSHGIPHELLLALLDGMEMDAAGRRYHTMDELREYCYHVAGVVGIMMARVMGVSDAPTLRCAEELGIAMQLTNIARDVVDDARAGRVYLPLEWLVEEGIPVEHVAALEHRAALTRVVARLLDRADAFYASAESGIIRLPARSAWSIATASRIYSEIGRVIRGRRERAWDGRAVVSWRRKMYWLGRSLVETLYARLP